MNGSENSRKREQRQWSNRSSNSTIEELARSSSSITSLDGFRKASTSALPQTMRAGSAGGPGAPDATTTNSPRNDYNQDMPEPLTRPELDAKLQTIEAKMDGRIARIEDAVERISKDNSAMRVGISELKKTMIITATTAVIAIILGIAAFNATLTSNMLNAFQVGQQTNSQAKK